MTSHVRVRRSNVLGEFVSRMEEAVDEVRLTVFVCGPFVPRKKAGKKRTPGAIARQFVTSKITELGSVVIWGEHFANKKLPSGRLAFKYFTDADKEVLFAHKYADLIIIFPESAGSLAELGGFSLHDGVARKMLVVFDKHRKGDKGYVIQAVARAAKSRKARIRYRDYRRLEELWGEVRRTLKEYKTRKVTSESYAKT
jgi:hypothetical protein